MGQQLPPSQAVREMSGRSISMPLRKFTFGCNQIARDGGDSSASFAASLRNHNLAFADVMDRREFQLEPRERDVLRAMDFVARHGTNGEVLKNLREMLAAWIVSRSGASPEFNYLMSLTYKEVQIVVHSIDGAAAFHLRTWAKHRDRRSGGAGLLSIDGSYMHVDPTRHFDRFYDNTLAAKSESQLGFVSEFCDDDYDRLIRNYFAVNEEEAGRYTIYLDAGTFGSFHTSGESREIHCASGSIDSASTMQYLVAAEVVEVLASSFGWDCNTSDGEGLSRAIAGDLTDNKHSEYFAVEEWASAPDRDRNFVDKNDTTDGNLVSIGCATLFLNYLHYVLEDPWPRIVRARQKSIQGDDAPATRLTDVYRNLGHGDDGFQAFMQAYQVRQAAGGQADQIAENPFKPSA